MKLFKKIVSVFLAMSMVNCVAFAKREVSKSNENVYNLLTSLGIVDNTFEFKYEKSVSRLEFAVAAAAAGNYDVSSQEPTGVFADVSVDNEYAPDIEYLYNSGIIGGDDGMFYPDRDITLDEAMVILLRVAGYSDIVKANGGYPSGYKKVARNEGLLDNVTSQGIISGDDMLVLLYNMLNMKATNLLYEDADIYSEDDTILSKRHNVYYRKGIVKSNDLTSLYAKSSIGKNEISIETKDGDVVIGAGNTDIGSMLGCKVIAYYRYDDVEGVSTCVYYEFDKQNEIFELDFDEIDEITSIDIKYSKTKSQKKIKIDRPIIIWNKAYYAGDTLTKDMLDKYTGSIKAIDNDDDGVYEVLNISAYQSFVVGNVIAEDKYFYDLVAKDENGKSLKVDISDENTDYYNMKYADGSDAVLEDIVSGTVITIGRNAELSELKILDVIVSDTKKSGVVTRVYKDDNDRDYIELDNNEAMRVINMDTLNFPGTGSGITAFVDCYGNVIYIENKYLGDFAYGLIIRSYYNDDNQTDAVDMFTMDNKIQKYDLADRVQMDGREFKRMASDAIINGEKVIVDGKPLTEAEYIFKTLKEFAVSVGDYAMTTGVLPIRYKLNADGKISVIDTQMADADGNENTLTTYKDEYGDEYGSSLSYSQDGVLGAQIPMNGQTVVLSISTTDYETDTYTNEANMRFGGISSFRNNAKTSFKAYKVDKDSPYADFVIYFKSLSDGGRGDYVCVVDNYDSLVYDEESEETIHSLKCYVAGKPMNIPIEKDFYDESFSTYNINQGDIIEYSLNSAGQICELYRHTYKVESHKVLEVTLDGNKIKTLDYHNIDEGKDKRSSLISDKGARIALMGSVKTRREGLIEYYFQEAFNKIEDYWTEEDMKYISTYYSTSQNKKNLYRAVIGGSVPITVVDYSKPKNERVYSGTYDDIHAMDDGFDDHSRVLIRYYNCYVQEVIVYND